MTARRTVRVCRWRRRAAVTRTGRAHRGNPIRRIFGLFAGCVYNAPMNTITNDSEPSRPWLFKPGNNANPAGRPIGSVGGRTRALQILDEISSKEDNVALLAEAMNKAFQEDPLAFFQKVMKDLIPKESLVKIAAEAPQRKMWGTLEESMESDDKTRANLRALRAEFPGKDSIILDMIIEEHCPLGALRCQLQSYSHRLPGHEPFVYHRQGQEPPPPEAEQ